MKEVLSFIASLNEDVAAVEALDKWSKSSLLAAFLRDSVVLSLIMLAFALHFFPNTPARI